MKISIIVPVFNTEKYIKNCIDSCLNQDIDSSQYEIILVNDGSTDNSLEILKEYESKYRNIFVFSQENKKQGAARNLGLSYAKGKYIWFVDSDDWIEPNILKFLIYKMDESSLDILAIGAKNHHENDNSVDIREIGYQKNVIYKRWEVFLEQKFNVSTPFHIFKKDFLKKSNMQFLENISYEDNEFMIKALDKVERFKYIDAICYHVLLRLGSTTRNTNYDNLHDLVNVINSLIKYFNLNMDNYPNQVKIVFCRQIAECQNSLLFGTRKSKNAFIKSTDLLRQIQDLNLYIYKSRSWAHFIQFKLIKFPLLLRYILVFYYR